MRDADQSTFDVVATRSAAALRRTIPSRNAAFVSRPMIPMNTITRAPSAWSAVVFQRREPDAPRGDLPHAGGNRIRCIGHAHDAFRAQDETSRQ
ncbi:UNVERIFIED_ORG: hypothetical protein ABIC48_006808 [Burkholderia territorii]